MAAFRPGIRIDIVFCFIALAMHGSKPDAASANDTGHESGWDAARAFPVYTSESVETCSSVLSAQLDRCRTMMAKAVAKSYLAAEQVQSRKGSFGKEDTSCCRSCERSAADYAEEQAEKLRVKAAKEARGWDETVSVMGRLFAPFTLRDSDGPPLSRSSAAAALNTRETPTQGHGGSSASVCLGAVPEPCAEQTRASRADGLQGPQSAHVRIANEHSDLPAIAASERIGNAVRESEEVDRSWWTVPYVPQAGTSSSGGASGALGAEYNDWRQVLAHAARDWTDMGARPRATVYQPLVEQLSAHLSPETAGTRTRVLVPGCGTARLAFDIALCGYSVEASDVSVTTMAAASAILNDQMRWLERGSADRRPAADDANGRGGPERTAVFPLLFASLNSQVSQSELFRSHSIPDVDAAELGSCRDRLWLHLGSFEASYNTLRAHDSFDAVVTCFFLDCTEDIISTIAVIRHVLRKGGIWVNSGPLDYHQSSTLTLDAEQLREVIGIAGFEVLSWQEVREEWDGGHSLRRTAYRPIMFTAKAV